MGLDLEKQKDGNRQVTFGWKDVSFSVDTKAGKKQILQNVSGFVKPGIFHRKIHSKNRWFTRDHGPFWVWENHAFGYFVAPIAGLRCQRRTNDQ